MSSDLDPALRDDPTLIGLAQKIKAEAVDHPKAPSDPRVPRGIREAQAHQEEEKAA